MNFEQKTAFAQIRQLLASHCLSDMSKEPLNAMGFTTRWEEIVRMQEENEEFRQILLFENDFPLQHHADLREELKRLQIEGSRIELEDLCELESTLECIQAVLLFFRVESEKEENRFPRLQQQTENIRVENALVRAIASVVDDKGRIRDNASPELLRIRQQIFHTEREIEKNLKKIITQAKQDHLVETDAEMTVRDGRLCLPVPAAFKRRLKGFIHDESSSGQTVFIEPQEVFDSNNDLRDLQLAESREIHRILTEITRNIRPFIPDILTAYDFLGYLDFVRAKAKLALDIQAVKPIMVNRPAILWKKARHPLLHLNLKRQQKSVVPMDVSLNEKQRILILSGPNAGGKSVCLKTIGLLQYMFQCGLPVSASENSEFGCFQRLFIDIGDEQSIENDLSTYSSHLKNMDEIVQGACQGTLFLIDELGGGTDPQYGGAIAEATLEYLSHTGALGMVTTHFGNLKTMAETIEGIENAAMLFDRDEMRPLFQLKTGKAGSSFTFDIAERIGFSQTILNNAKQKIGSAQLDYEALLQKVELEKMHLEEERRMCKAMDEQLSELIEQQKDTNAHLQQQRHDILKKAKQEAESLMENANKIIERTVREIKEHKADKVQVQKLREEVHAFHEEVKKVSLPQAAPAGLAGTSITSSAPIAVGDYVLLNETRTVGQVLERKGNDIVVSFHSVHFRTTIDKVSKTNQKPPQANGRRASSSGQADFYTEMNRKAAQFHLELDIRGMRAQEAEDALARYIDDALLLQIHEFRIIHGKGDGILRHVVRNYLSKEKNVRHFEDEAMERGGYGATIVRLD